MSLREVFTDVRPHEATVTAWTRPSSQSEIGHRYYHERKKGRMAPFRPRLSENSPFLSHDTKMAALIASRKASEDRAARDLVLQRRGDRELQLRSLLRRKAERETVENYIQNPFARSRGMRFGVEVIEDRIQFLREKIAAAAAAGATPALARLQVRAAATPPTLLLLRRCCHRCSFSSRHGLLLA